MIELLNYLLVYLGLGVLIWAWVAYPSKTDGDFVRIAVTFMAIFFLIPALMFISSEGYFYLYKNRELDHLKLLNALFCFYCFLLGFFAAGKYKFTVKKQNKYYSHDAENSKNFERIEISKLKLIYLSAATVLLLAFNQAVQPDVDTLYSVRQGDVEISPVFLLLSIATNSAALSLFFLFIKARWRVFALVIIFYLIIESLTAAAGRTTTILFICLAGIYLTNIRINRLTFFMPIIFVISLPIILIGKNIIFIIGSGGEIPNLYELLSNINNPRELYFTNFAHPFISMYEVWGTLELSGFRYFFDLPHGWLFYLRAFGLDMGSSLTYFNSENLLGIHESIVPTGYLAFGFIQAAYFGVIFMGALYRYLYGIIINMIFFRIAKSESFLFYAAFLSANTFYTGEMRTLVLSFFLPIVIMYVYGKLATKRSSMEELVVRR